VKWGRKRKIAPSRKCASYRNEVIDAYHRHQPALVDATAQCVSDSGGLATKSSQNFGSIESGLRSKCANFSSHPDRGNREACRDRQGETVRLRDALNRLFGEALTDLNSVLSLAPIPFTIAMMASTMPAAIGQSSTAATPDSPVRNLQNIFIEPFKGVELFIGVKSEEALRSSGKIRPILFGYG